ncbi:hypothetical protein [Sphingobacterium sp.]|uniref:hypothetical protein n=1 Tax=Sphingobacterium sp. TaxID=341027 RepID=UPI0031DCF6CD
MKGKKYTLDQIRLLETQLSVKRILKKDDLIYVSDDSFSIVQAILMKNDIKYTVLRDIELQINTLIIV